jgi:hypothetical protein
LRLVSQERLKAQSFLNTLRLTFSERVGEAKIFHFNRVLNIKRPSKLTLALTLADMYKKFTNIFWKKLKKYF